ncbi:MAG: PepSY domain-containing protein [Culicoidibacterales bacterium]
MLKNKQILLLIGGLILSSIIAVKASEPEVLTQTMISQEEAIAIVGDNLSEPDLELVEVYFENNDETTIMYLQDGQWEEVLYVTGTETTVGRSSYIVRSENEYYKYTVKIDAYTGKVIGLEKMAKSMSR